MVSPKDELHQMTSVHISSGLAPPRQMTSDHNSSELGIHDHSNELSSSKLVLKVVPPADKTATSRQDSQAVNRVYGIILVIVKNIRVNIYVLTMKMEILLEPASNKLLENELRLNQKDMNYPDSLLTVLYALSVPVMEQESMYSIYIIKWSYGTGGYIKSGDWFASIPAEVDSLPLAHAQSYKTFYKASDFRM
ncbi:hypothetical protein Tco_0556594 [Tanacetum coccineum]